MDGQIGIHISLTKKLTFCFDAYAANIIENQALFVEGFIIACPASLTEQLLGLLNDDSFIITCVSLNAYIPVTVVSPVHLVALMFVERIINDAKRSDEIFLSIFY